MNENDFKSRTRQFAIRTIKLVTALPPGRASDVIGRQLLKSGTSVGANYRAACRAKSVNDMTAKLAIVEEECDESAYWIELITELKLVPPDTLAALLTEANEITAMVVSSIKTLRRRSQNEAAAIDPVAARRPIQNPKSKIQNQGSL